MFPHLGTYTGWRVLLTQQEYFFIMGMLKGYGKVSARLDTRLPITFSILERMCANCTFVPDSGYIACMFKAMCATAFYAFLRIGEITAT